MATGKIGFLDPGFAGLAIFRSVVERLPLHDYVYLACGVQERAADKGLALLLGHGCEVIIVPSVRLFSHVQALVPPTQHCLGVVGPIAEAVAAQTRNNRVGIISSNDTKEAEIFTAEIRKLKSEARVYQQACPLLVPLIEAGGRYHSQAIDTVLTGYLEPLLRGGIDVLVLGNAHYDLIKERVQQLVDGRVKIIDQATTVAAKLADYLGRNPELEKHLSKQKQRHFFAAADSKKAFEAMAREFYGYPINPLVVNLGVA